MQDIPESIAVVGFPGVGKTALAQHLRALQPATGFQFVEMPGIVMLGRNTPDEEHVYDLLLGRRADSSTSRPYGIIALVDAEDLDRQFYLVYQLIDLRLPFLLCINRLAEAEARGITIDVDRLASLTGVPIIPHPSDGTGLSDLLAAWEDQDVDQIKRKPSHWRPSTALADAYQHLDTQWIHKHLRLHTGARLVEGLRLLTVPKAVEEYEGHPAYTLLLRNLDEARQILADRNEKWTTAEVIQRSNWIGQALTASVTKTKKIDSPRREAKWWKSFFRSN